jgi:hypothetical protein
VEIEAADLKPLWGLVHGALTGRLACFDSSLRLTAREVALRRGETPLTLTDLEGKIEKPSGGSQADIAFRVTGFETPKPVQIRIARSRQTEPATTGGGLYTGEGALPCTWLELGFPELEAFGPEARFRGYLWVNESPQGRGGELAGHFAGVDLERLVAAHFPHTLRGNASLSVQQALFHQGRLQEATGWLTAGPGVIGRSLLDATADRLGMDRAAALEGAEQPVPYDRLAVSFRIDSGGLQLRGECPPPGSGAVLVSRDGLLLREPMVQPVPIAAVLQALVPTAHVQVPATRETDWLVRRLPVPHASAARIAEAPSPVPQ